MTRFLGYNLLLNLMKFVDDFFVFDLILVQLLGHTGLIHECRHAVCCSMSEYRWYKRCIDTREYLQNLCKIVE